MNTIKIIKIGGNIINDEDALQAFLTDFSAIKGPKILVHGGGKSATQLAKKMNVPVQMINGRRVTDAATLQIITMVYAGSINKNIVASLQANTCNAIGFSGADANTIIAKKRPETPTNYGYVGDITHVNTKVVELLLEQGITPVFCAISHDMNGQLLNTNADTIAAEIAAAISKKYDAELYYCFEKNGVLESIHDDDSVIENITTSSYETLKSNGIIADGMLPKLTNCFYALHNNVTKVCIGKPNMLFKKNSKHTTITI